MSTFVDRLIVLTQRTDAGSAVMGRMAAPTMGAALALQPVLALVFNPGLFPPVERRPRGIHVAAAENGVETPSRRPRRLGR